MIEIPNTECYTDGKGTESNVFRREVSVVVKPLADDFAPYASANSVIKVVQQYRNHGLPDPLTQSGLEQIGLPSSMASFTLRSIVFLGLMDEGGNFTADFTRIRRANTGASAAVRHVGRTTSFALESLPWPT